MMYGTLLAYHQRTTQIYQCKNQSFDSHVQIRAEILEDETHEFFLSNKCHFTLALGGLRLTISIFCAWSRSWRHSKFALNFWPWGFEGPRNIWMDEKISYGLLHGSKCIRLRSFQVHWILHHVNHKRLFSHKFNQGQWQSIKLPYLLLIILCCLVGWCGLEL